MVTIHYIGGSYAEQDLEYDNAYCSWAYCQHMLHKTLETGKYYAYDFDGGTRYRKVQCEDCARRSGYLW